MKPDHRSGTASPPRGGAPTLRDIEAATGDPLVHDRLRLAVLTLLAAHEERSFTELRDTLSVTDGNLVTHLRRLEEAGYVTSRKETGDGRPRSSFRVTRQGRQSLLRYVEEMERALKLARRAAESAGGLSLDTRPT